MTIASKILEAIITPKNSLGIKREDMPQIDGKHVEDFLKYVHKCGRDYERVELPAKALQPSQGELDTDKAQKIWDEYEASKNEGANPLAGEIIVSQDKYVLDGHHRWLAVKENQPDMKIKCIMLGDNARPALDLMHGFEKTTKRDIEDNKVKESFTLSDLMLESYKPVKIPFEKLKKHKVDLSKDERATVKEKGAEWSDDRSAVFKSVIDGKSYYTTHTHRAYNCCPTLAGACERFHSFIKGTA